MAKTKTKSKKTPAKKEQVTVLLRIKRGEKEQVVVSRKTYKGKESIDVRIFWAKDDEWLPSQKGASIPIEKAAKVAKRILKSLRENPVEGASDE